MVAESLTQRAYEHVQAGIFSGRLKAGEVISEATLAKELGISRSYLIQKCTHYGLERKE